MKKSILISGISGFLGSHLAREFSKEYEVVGIKRSSSNIYRIADIANLILYNIDEVELETIFDRHRPTLVFHTAVNYGRNNEKLSDIINTNINLSIKMIEYSILFNTDTFFNTDTLQQDYLNYYTTTKKHIRDYLVPLSKEIQIINCKLEHMYGYDDGKDKFVCFLMESLQNNKASIALTKGEQMRDFIYIDDVVSAYKVLVANLYCLPKFAEFDIGTGKQVSIREFCIYLADEFKKYQCSNNSILDFGAIPYRKGEPMHIDEDIAPLLKLGFIPKYDYKKGISDMLFRVYNSGGGGGAFKPYC